MFLVFTLTSLCWSQLESEALRYTPWLRLHQHNSVSISETLMLNYFSTVKPAILLQAAKVGDWLVASVVSATMMLQILAIFSASLFAMERVGFIKHGQPVIITSEFVDRIDPRVYLGWQSSRTMVAMRTYDLPFPPGTGRGFAYQDFISENEQPDYVQVHAEVEILRGDVECEAGEVVSHGGYLGGEGENILYGELTARAPTCPEPFSFTYDYHQLGNHQMEAGKVLRSILYTDYAGDDEKTTAGGSCARDIAHFIYRKETFREPDAEGRKNLTLNAATVVSCRLGASITPAQVLQSSTGATYSVNPHAVSRPVPFDVGTLIHNMGSFNDGGTGMNLTYSSVVGKTIETEYEGHEWPDAFPIQPSQTPLFHPDSLLNQSFALEFVENALEEIIPLTARYLAMQSTSRQAAGSIVVAENRLLVRTPQFSVMTALFSLVIASAVVALVLVPKKPFAPQDPATGIACATLLSKNPELRERLRNTGHLGNQEINAKLNETVQSINLHSVICTPMDNNIEHVRTITNYRKYGVLLQDVLMQEAASNGTIPGSYRYGLDLSLSA
ncbi:hypothetical protein B0I35DRAFT_193890 [Stachybotrys elegans]|uniref:Uncharacterized protein n=1 Tax=Stachybotrys elegans TaxID=80388 RepID=A0A8K0WTD2_9HYPO|nr:hypothetical protein B0I35DRAFT_193890 [Stachybotrys elegans]